jgi:glycosyltransferase involved in cell wall biosynthesis
VNTSANTSTSILFSVIVPVFNRPDEVEELLQSLCQQTHKNFEVVIVEDGSQVHCEEIVRKYASKLIIQYFFKPNSGPGDSRNFGANHATGDYFIFFDSDCIIPTQYFEIVHKYLTNNFIDAYGGADASHKSFSDIQKAISYAMTSTLTTGGIRGGKNYNPKKFHPRSFNMGFSREVFEATNGFGKMRFGEDIDMSLRILAKNFKTTLIQGAFVYHKRRTDFKKFFKQVHNSGIARINLYKRHPKSLKLVHFLPSVFTVGVVFLCLVASVFQKVLFLAPLMLYVLAIFIESLVQKNSIKVAFLSVPASFVQLFGYGTGFLRSFWNRIILKKDEFQAFERNFYK